MLELIVKMQLFVAEHARRMREDGATAVEYALLMGLLMLAILAGAVKYNTAVNKSYNNITNSIAGALDPVNGP